MEGKRILKHPGCYECLPLCHSCWFVETEDTHRYTPLSRQGYKFCALQYKVLIPLMQAWIEEGNKPVVASRQEHSRSLLLRQLFVGVGLRHTHQMFQQSMPFQFSVFLRREETLLITCDQVMYTYL